MSGAHQTLHPTAARSRSCRPHRKFSRPIRSGRLLPAVVVEVFVGLTTIIARTMNTADNKSIVRAYVEAFNRGDLEGLRALFREDAEIQGVLGRGVVDKVMPIWRQLVEGYTMHLEIEEIIGEGDRVAVRYTETGTFVAPAFGHEPTGKSYTLVAMEWFVIEDGKIARRWGARDAASQARQLGIAER